MNFKQICIIGLGYMGLPIARILACTGIQVFGVEINHGLIDTLYLEGSISTIQDCWKQKRK